MVRIVERLWRRRRHLHLFCAVVACCLVLTVVSRLWSYQRWVAGASTLNAAYIASSATESPAPFTIVSRSSTSSETTVTGLDDIFISVKTTGKYHDTRIRLLLRTWLSLAQNQVRLGYIDYSYFICIISNSSNKTNWIWFMVLVHFTAASSACVHFLLIQYSVPLLVSHQ